MRSLLSKRSSLSAAHCWSFRDSKLFAILNPTHLKRPLCVDSILFLSPPCLSGLDKAHLPSHLETPCMLLPITTRSLSAQGSPARRSPKRWQPQECALLS